MAETMRTFVMERIGKVGTMEKPIPTPGPNDAVIKTTAALICTSDAHTVAGAIGERTNLTLGHEAVGIVAKLGREVRGFKEGDRVEFELNPEPDKKGDFVLHSVRKQAGK